MILPYVDIHHPITAFAWSDLSTTLTFSGVETESQSWSNSPGMSVQSFPGMTDGVGIADQRVNFLNH